MNDTPRVWIGCLAAYNGGRLHGDWVDATDEDELQEAKDRILKSSPEPLAEEWFIADYDGFGNLASTLGEYAQFEQVARIGRLIEEQGDRFVAFVTACEPALDTVDSGDFENHWRGEWESEKDYAEDYVTQVGWASVESIPSSLLPYLDMGSIADELFRHGNYVSAPAPGGKVWVFEQEV